MSKKFVELFLLVGFLVLAVLLYGSTAAYPQAVQGSTAAYVRFLAISLGILCLFETIFCFRRKRTAAKQDASQGQEAKGEDDKPSSDEETFRIGAHPKAFWLLFLLLMLYAGAFSYLGFYVASAFFLPLTMFALGARKLISICLTTLGVLGFVYVVFEQILEVYMPAGTFFG